jgi:steroid 5-alpha reductase family enzyme
MNASFLQLYALGRLLILALMTLLWLLSLRLKDASIVDPFWGSGFVIVNWFYFSATADNMSGRQWLLVILVTI